MKTTTKALKLGVDQLTVVVRPLLKVDVTTWENVIDAILEQFLILSAVESIFGMLKRTTSKTMQGYNEGIFAEDRPFYFSINWNANFQEMGIAINFSAHSWAFFTSEYSKIHGEKMDVAKFIKMIQCDSLYTTRISRIDLTADYLNYGLKVDDIYNGLKSHQLQVKNYKNHTIRLKTSALEINHSAETIYLGSRKGNTQGFLRIYDKRKEQIDKHGIRLGEALASKDWVRFEAVYKGKKSHQITEILLNQVHNVHDLQRWIAQAITDKYSFFDKQKDDEAEFTSDLLDIAFGKTSFNHLSSPSPRDNSLRQSIHYIVTNSGLYACLFKIEALYGSDGVQKFWEFLANRYQFYTPNKDTEIWIDKHGATMLKQTLEDSL